MKFIIVYTFMHSQKNCLVINFLSALLKDVLKTVYEFLNWTTHLVYILTVVLKLYFRHMWNLCIFASTNIIEWENALSISQGNTITCPTFPYPFSFKLISSVYTISVEWKERARYTLNSNSHYILYLNSYSIFF